jgi:hypothetical protein
MIMTNLDIYLNDLSYPNTKPLPKAIAIMDPSKIHAKPEKGLKTSYPCHVNGR